MAKTYDVYIAESMYDLIYPTNGVQRRCLHFEDVSEMSLEHLKAIANEGEIALAYMVLNEND